MKTKKKNKGLHLKSIPDFSIFLPISWSLKKRSSSNRGYSCPFYVISKSNSKTQKFRTLKNFFQNSGRYGNPNRVGVGVGIGKNSSDSTTLLIRQTC